MVRADNRGGSREFFLMSQRSRHPQTKEDPGEGEVSVGIGPGEKFSKKEKRRFSDVG